MKTMNRMFSLGIVLILIGQFSLAQDAQDQSNATTPGAAIQLRFAPGTALRVELVKTIDAKKANAGDPVVVKTTEELTEGSQVVAPRGTKIFGHVVTATAHHGDTASTLEIAFDKITLGSGNEIPLKAVVQALSKPVQSASAGDYGSAGTTTGQSPMGGPMGSPAGGRMGGGLPQSTPNNGGMGNPNGMPGAGSRPQSAPLPANAQGVIGISDLSLSAETNSVLTSQKHNVKLEDGTQMILRVTQ
jgi:hypothetical protein